MALAVNDTPNSALARIWAQAACAALEGGKHSKDAVLSADEVTLAYDARFSPENDDKIGATLTMEIALKYYERSALVGKTVSTIGQTDLPSLGKIKDFSNGSHVQEDLALIQWTSNGPDGDEESWVSIHKLQLLMKLG